MANIANRDEAMKCKSIAMEALENGDREKCLRFLEKSYRMYDDQSTLDFITRLKASAPRATSASSNTANAADSAAGTSRRPSSNEASDSGGGPGRTNGDGKPYTKEQFSEVQMVLRCTDYYEILQVTRSATDDDVKKAYRRLALKFHPDKCNAPGSDEAFKKVSKAFQCLSDRSKRSSYDVSGRDPDHNNGGGGGGRGGGNDEDFEFMTAQEIFEAFFGVPVSGHNRRVNRRQGGHHHAQNHPLIGAGGIGYLPVLLFLGVTILGSLFQQASHVAPKFSLRPNNQFPLLTQTHEMAVNYYAPYDHHRSYPVGSPQLAQFDKQVETIYVQNLHHECEYETQQIARRIQYAKHRGNEKDLQAIAEAPRPSCETYEALQRKFPTIFHKRKSVYSEL